jgi:hypothetical protein
MDAEHLAELVEIVKDHHQAIRHLMADVNGLKMTLTGADMQKFDPARKAKLDELAESLESDSRRFDEMIAKLRS